VIYKSTVAVGPKATAAVNCRHNAVTEVAMTSSSEDTGNTEESAEHAKEAIEHAAQAEERAREAELRAREAEERAREAEEHAREAWEHARDTDGGYASDSGPDNDQGYAPYVDSDGGEEPPGGGPE
jgi:hypothetical protein